MLVRSNGLLLNYLSFVVGASLWGAWKLRRKSFDLVFIYEPSPVTVALPAILIGRIKKIPVVFWVLDLWPETLSAVGAIRSGRVLQWVGLLVQFIYDRCTLILGQSRAFFHGIAKYCQDSSKIRYYPSWAEEIFTDPNSNKAPEVSDCEGCFNIVFAGNIGESQDMPAILEAAELLRSEEKLRWLIIGDGRKYGWLHAEVKQRNLVDNVILLGRYSIERMPSFYAHADALLVSLKKDPVFAMTIPAKLQTYLMSGVPVLAMLDGEGAQVVRNSKSGLSCDAGDFEALASCVRQMMTIKEADRKLMGSNGRKYAQKEFDRNMLITRLEKIFDEAVYLYKTDR